MSNKILVVDDDANIRELLRLYLQREGYSLFLAANGSEGLTVFREIKPDIVILDVMMPIINGLEVCNMIRQESDIPIIMLTARDATDDKLSGFEQGADDYVVKPFDAKEVVARVKAHLKRQTLNQDHSQNPSYILGNMEVNINTYEAKVDGRGIKLKPKEMQLIIFLIKNKNIVFSRDQLLEKVWDYDYGGETRTVDVHIKRLREKLGDSGQGWELKTVWGIGYKLEVT